MSDQRMFSDVHSHLEKVMSDLNNIRDQLTTNEQRHQHGADAIRKELEQERFDNRDSTNKFRYEFDELVHKRVETVFEGLEEMQQSQKYKDRQQQLQLDGLQREIGVLKQNLVNVSGTWAKHKEKTMARQPLSKDNTMANFDPSASGNVLKKPSRNHGMLDEVMRLSAKKAASHLFEIVENLRTRVKIAAQGIHGESWPKVFTNQDKDGSGYIDFREFKQMCTSLLRLQEPEASLRVVFESLDTDRSGSVSLEELIDFVGNPSRRMKKRLTVAIGQTESGWQQLMRDYDKDASGQICFSEFKVMCRMDLKLLDKEVHLRQIFKVLDTDGSGEISTAEFLKWVNEQ